MVPPERKRAGRSLHTGVVRRTEQISPTMIRVVAGGDGLSAFALSGYTDAYVKVVFLAPGIDYPRPLDLQAIQEQLPRESWPRNRTYTVRNWDDAAREITIDFVVHGDEGLAGPWAKAVKPGDEILLLGPGGGYAPDRQAGWHLFAGDESALPAIAAALENLADDARGAAFVEVHDADDEQPVTVPGGVTFTWLHRGDRPTGELLVEAVTGLEFGPGPVQAFVHGEAGFVRDLRRFLKGERGLKNDQLSISGYWRAGEDDEGWRTVKRGWNQAIEDSEAAAGIA